MEFRWVQSQLGFFLGQDRSRIHEQVKNDIQKLQAGPVAGEAALYALYDAVFERNARSDTLDRSYAFKILRLLLCSKEPLTLVGIGAAFVPDDVRSGEEILSDTAALRLI